MTKTPQTHTDLLCPSPLPQWDNNFVVGGVLEGGLIKLTTSTHVRQLDNL